MKVGGESLPDPRPEQAKASQCSQAKGPPHTRARALPCQLTGRPSDEGVWLLGRSRRQARCRRQTLARPHVNGHRTGIVVVDHEVGRVPRANVVTAIVVGILFAALAPLAARRDQSHP